MQSIKENIINEIEIKKSKFITLLYNINNKDDVNNYLSLAKQNYKDATHYCYAYIIDDEIKASDDGEPSGTAGIPILEILNKNSLNFVLCIVVRYFGGIKLGAGGLIRAYSRSVKDAIKNNMISLIKGYEVIINFDYKDEKEITYLLKDVTVLDKTFLDNISYKIECEDNTIKLLEQKNINYKIISQKYIKKVD